MKQRSEGFLTEVGISPKDFPLERHTGKGFYNIQFHSETILLVAFFGQADFDLINDVNAFLTEYNYQRGLRFPNHRTNVIIDLSSNQHLLTNKQYCLLKKIIFAQTIVVNEGKKNGFRKFLPLPKQADLVISQNMDEALLLVLTRLQVLRSIESTDFYTHFMQLWTQSNQRQTFLDTNIKTIKNAAWALSIDAPPFYSSFQVAEGNIFIARVSGSLSSIAIDRFFFMLKTIGADLKVKIPNQKLILVLDATNVTSVSLRMMRIVSSFLVREKFINRIFIIPSGLISSFYFLNRIARPGVFKFWTIVGDLKTAVEKAIEYQSSASFFSFEAVNENGNTPCWKVKENSTVNELFEALQPLMSIDYLNSIVQPIHNPQSLKDIIHNIIFNAKINLEEQNLIVRPDTDMNQTENILNLISQPIIYCWQSQVLWANVSAYSTWGYRVGSLTNQPLSVLLELTNIATILTFDTSTESLISVTTYHFEGHTITMSCKKVLFGNDHQNHFYLIFYLIDN